MFTNIYVGHGLALCSAEFGVGQINLYRYTDAGSNVSRVRYGTDVESTRAHLRTADSLGLGQVGFWTWDQANGDVGKAMAWSLMNWSATT